MVSWYKQVYKYSRHLSIMIETEIEYATALNDAKMIQAAKDNFSKILTTVACGCYSNNADIA